MRSWRSVEPPRPGAVAVQQKKEAAGGGDGKLSAEKIAAKEQQQQGPQGIPDYASTSASGETARETVLKKDLYDLARERASDESLRLKAGETLRKKGEGMYVREMHCTICACP